MSRLSMEELMKSLKEERGKKLKEKKIALTLDEIRYKEFVTAIVLSSNGEEEVYETFNRITKIMVDTFIDSVDFYDLTEEDMDAIVDIFEELI